MGQYYKPVNTENLSWLYSHDYGSGLKLMEHSWDKNTFVGAVESLLTKGGQWYKKPLVWCGDYAQNVEDGKGTLKDKNYYSACEDRNKLFPKGTVVTEKYIYNHTKKEFVDKKKVPKDNDGWRMHPLPLLTSIGNGQGGGDFHVNNNGGQGNVDLIGSWAGDVISVESRKPAKSLGFKEIEFDLVER